MLIRFEVSNFRSIDEAAELSMVAVDRDREPARAEPHLGESLLTRAAIYGANASGKSNVVSALAWLSDAVELSLRFWEDEIPLEQFAFTPSRNRTSEFILELSIDGVRFEYVLELDSQKIYYEGLFHYPEKKRRRIFEREGSDLKLQRGLGAVSGARELLTDRTLALTAARRFDEPLISRFALELSRIQTFGISRPRTRRLSSMTRSTRSWFEESEPPDLFSTSDESPSERDRALALLRLADLGIEDVTIERQESSLPNSTDPQTVRRVKVQLLHRTNGEAMPLDFSAESQGTKTWFGLIGPLLTALETGAMMVFDELDASLHPTLSAELLRIFGSRSLNPRGAQLVFTTHDTSLLDHLNRDEVWLTEKVTGGSTRLGALADFAGERVRKSQNLEKAYLHGRFGALPQVDQAPLLRALGLIG